ncbi:MAG: hypothetical protein K0T00_1603 [Gaiellaceae bacterium]|nr:hypothetical protein [Gaiellaceae bacterium]
MPSQTKEVAMLTILLATCETALQAFAAADDVLDEELVDDLERVAARTRRELEALAAR